MKFDRLCTDIATASENGFYRFSVAAMMRIIISYRLGICKPAERILSTIIPHIIQRAGNAPIFFFGSKFTVFLFKFS
ncbi:MAG: hypothetical protein IJW99_02990 [Clostridia bacterium]|nr:hypothetical protein [Clostridia bacterium]